MRQTDRIGDEIMVRVSHENARVLSEKTEREVPAPAHI